MASSSKRLGKAANTSILTPVMTLEGHQPYLSDGDHYEFKDVSYFSYFANGKEMISGSGDKTIRRWDLREGKEIEEAQKVCENGIEVVGISSDGRWVITAGRDLKVCEVETGIVRTFYDGLDRDRFIHISADSMLMAGGSTGSTVWIWNLDTGKLVAGPFQFTRDDYSDDTPALRFSENSKKLAVLSKGAQCLQVWDVQTQKLDVTRGNSSTENHSWNSAPVFWTTKDKSIVAAFSFTDDDDSPTTIYEFDALTLETVGDSFEGHTSEIHDLSLSFDCALLVSTASAPYENTIKLWSFESRQLLASFEFHAPRVTLILSPDSRQLAYTVWNETNIYICNIPPNILARVGIAEEAQPSTNKPQRPRLTNMLNSDATRRRKPVILPVISPFPHPPRPPPTRDTRFFHFLRKLLPSRTDAVRPIRNNEPRNPLDFPATAPLPRSHTNLNEDFRPAPAPLTTESIHTSTTFKSRLHQLITWWPGQADNALPAIVDVPLAPGKLRYATAGAPAPDDDMIRDEGSPPPSPNLNSRQPPAGQINIGEHGGGRLCFCL